MIHVVDVKYIGGLQLALRFDDGTSGTADLTGRLRGRLKALEDPVRMAEAFVDDGTVCWPGGLDLAPEFLFGLAHGLEPPRTFQEAKANELTVSLRELRKMVDKTQVEIAAALEMTQAEVSKLEARTDVKLSTLARYVRACGGELELVARVGAKTVRIGGGLLDEPERTA